MRASSDFTGIGFSGDHLNPFNEKGTPEADPADAELVAAAQTGNKESLEKLVRRHQPWVFNIALRMVWRREAAEDATQEILIKVVTKLSTFRGQSHFRTWLYRIAINHLLNVRKAKLEEAFGVVTPPAQEKPEFYHGNYNPIYDASLKASGKNLT